MLVTERKSPICDGGPNVILFGCSIVTPVRSSIAQMCNKRSFHGTHVVPVLSLMGARVDLPALANFLGCARTATRVFLSTATPLRTKQAGLWLSGLGLEHSGRGSGRR